MTLDTNQTELASNILVERRYINNIVWGSIDPHTGEIAIYAPDISNLIETGYINNETTLKLDIFNGVIITFNNKKPYQQTSSGYRSVFRHELDEHSNKITKNVEYNTRYSAWYLKENKVSHIGFLVDTSGSMSSIYKNVVEQGLLEFINEQKKVENDVKFYGSTFSNELNHLFNGVDLKTDTTINEKYLEIIPSGSTAYYDAVCDMIGFITNNYSINDEVVMVIVSDGGDNCSRRHSLDTMKNMIIQKKNQGWNIVMIGTNSLNAEQVSQRYGLDRNSSLNTAPTQEGMQHAFRGISAGISRYRNGENNGIVFTEAERASSGR